MKKKLLTILLIATMAINLSACGSKETSNNDSNNKEIEDLEHQIAELQKQLDKAQQETSNNTINKSYTESGQVAKSVSEEYEIPGEAVFTASQDAAVVLSEARLLKEQNRARNKETLMDIINSTEISDEQKQAAVDRLIKMTEVAEKEVAAEIMLKEKGFTDTLVSINDNVVDVVVNTETINDDMRARIEDIVKRETGIPAENIIISTVTK